MLFYGKLPTISEHPKKTFFLGYFLAEVRSSGLEACNVSEKEDFCKYFLGIFESFENSFLSELFKKNICSGVFRLAVGCRLYSCNRIKKELYYIHFSRYFPKFYQYSFPTYPHKIICDEVCRVLGCTRDRFLKVLT